jgi:hypothetical protein
MRLIRAKAAFTTSGDLELNWIHTVSPMSKPIIIPHRITDTAGKADIRTVATPIRNPSINSVFGLTIASLIFVEGILLVWDSLTSIVDRLGIKPSSKGNVEIGKST